LYLNVANSSSFAPNIHPNQFPEQAVEGLTGVFFIVAPYILKSKASHLPTDALFITLGKV
jgi:hypothetical protein